LRSAIAGLQAAGDLAKNCQHRPLQYLEQRPETGSPGDPSAGSTRVSIFAHSWELGARFAGYEAIHMIRKGQACWSAAGVKVGLLHHFMWCVCN